MNFKCIFQSDWKDLDVTIITISLFPIFGGEKVVVNIMCELKVL